MITECVETIKIGADKVAQNLIILGATSLNAHARQLVAANQVAAAIRRTANDVAGRSIHEHNAIGAIGDYGRSIDHVAISRDDDTVTTIVADRSDRRCRGAGDAGARDGVLRCRQIAVKAIVVTGKLDAVARHIPDADARQVIVVGGDHQSMRASRQ